MAKLSFSSQVFGVKHCAGSLEIDHYRENVYVALVDGLIN